MVKVTPLEDGWYLVDDGERRRQIAVAIDGGATWIFADGQVSRIEAPSGGGRTSAKKRGEGSVMSPMPATVVSINIAAGDMVTEGQTLIVLEAMKMELPIKAPRGGVVKALHCAKGDLVQPGVNLLDIG